MNKYFCIIILIFSSCSQINHLNKTIYNYPDFGSNDQIQRIIIGKDFNISDKNIETDICINSFILSFNELSKIKIVDTLYFNKDIDSSILDELKQKYNVDGILVLTDLYDSKSINRREGIASLCGDCPPPVPYYTYEIAIKTNWKYFDFKSSKKYSFNIENSTNEQRLKNNEYSLDENTEFLIKEQLLFENGKICSNKLLGH